jgi:hypothetical protein
MSFLRPQYTQTLLETLKKESVNVHGPYGQGQTRLLDDLSQLAREQGFIVLSADMKSWAENYDGMIGYISGQLRSQLPAVTEQINDLAQLISALDTHAETTTVLMMLQHFDALLDNAVHLNEKYTGFFPHLNSLRNQKNRVLLAITAKPYSQYRFYIDKIHNTSPLDLKLRELKNLSYEEIKTELQVRVSPLSEQDMALLTRTIHSNHQAFEFLEYCTEQLNDGYESELSLNKRLKVWNKSFKHNHKRSFRRQLDTIRNKFAIAIREALAFKLLFGSAVGLITTLIVFFDKIKQPAISLLKLVGLNK